MFCAMVLSISSSELFLWAKVESHCNEHRPSFGAAVADIFIDAQDAQNRLEFPVGDMEGGVAGCSSRTARL